MFFDFPILPRTNRSEKHPCIGNKFFSTGDVEKTSLMELVFKYIIQIFVQTNCLNCLTLIWVGIIGICFEGREGLW